MHSRFAGGYGTELSESDLTRCGESHLGRTWGRVE